MVRILLAEDAHVVRGALVALLDLEPDFTVVADVHDGYSIVPAALAHKPDVAVLDVGLPGLDGVSAARRLGEALPSCRILILTSLGSPATLRRAMNANVHGFLLKDAPVDDLIKGVRTVAAGFRFIDPELAAAAWAGRESPLSPREAEILGLVAGGGTTAEIAAELFLNVGTVRNYLNGAVTKTGGRSRIDAIRIARDNGWLP
ncbi:response regulator transcription factor [Catenulispora subtropica]|uniref:Response regulator transcription factor n=1 Tax=Catenulispora subtropica TaxID=450798 RepID=A0ABP5E8D1_9ACTN